MCQSDDHVSSPTHTSSPRRTVQLVDRACPTCGSRAHRVEAAGPDWEYGSCDGVFNFVACAECSTLYLEPRPASDDFDVIYPQTYYTRGGTRAAAPSAVAAAWRTVERRRTRDILRLVEPGRRRVLDVGCGDGRLLATLRRTPAARGWHLVGIEPALSDEARSAAVDLDLELHEGLYEAARFGRDAFDLVVAQQVIEHVVDPGAALAKMRDELRPGGHAILDTPNADGLDRALFRRSLWGGYHFPRHMTLFTPVTLAELAGRVGLDVVEVRPLLSPVFWVTSLHNAAVALGLPRAVTSRVTYRSLPLVALATLLDAPVLALTGRTSNMRAILRRRA
jgi:SAM-dependent methyltransferase